MDSEDKASLRKCAIERLSKALHTGDTNKLAHALIAFEQRDPTISESVTRAANEMLELESASDRTWCGYDNRVKTAIALRKVRLGDGLWFSKY